jgi:hypothetical protein
MRHWRIVRDRSKAAGVMRTNAILDTQFTDSFENGKYFVWMLRGHVQIRITPLSGNAVLSGVFFD